MPLNLPQLNVSTKKRICVADLTEEQKMAIKDFFAKDVEFYKKWKS